MDGMEPFTPASSFTYQSMDSSIDGDSDLKFPSLSHLRQLSQSTSDVPSPTSPTFSIGGHTRDASSASSASSSPAGCDQLDSSLCQKKTFQSLPDVVEDPMERENGEYELVRRPDSFDIMDQRTEDIQGIRDTLVSSLALENGFYSGHAGDDDFSFEPQSKRRKSGDSVLNGFASKISTRLPSFSKRSRDRKKTPVVASASSSGVTSPAPGRSRSNSRARSLFGRSRSEDVDTSPEGIQQGSTCIGTITEDEGQESGLGIQVDDTPDTSFSTQPEELQRVSTPLLPLATSALSTTEQKEMHSPLQEPPVAEFSAKPAQVGSFEGTPLASGMQSPVMGFPSPALSRKPSYSNFQGTHQSLCVPTPEIPSLSFSDTVDKWDERLGHANYHIQPAPYTPQQCDVESCRRMLADWNTARFEYSKHLARTSTHFGPTSKIHRLTEEKWAEIDSDWKSSYDYTITKSFENGQLLPPDEPSQPTPVTKIPSVAEGKFPHGGDEDIVGPLSVEPSAPQIQRRASKKAQLKKMIGGLQFPASVLNRPGA